MDKFEKLRQEYPVFEYNSYDVEYNNRNIRVVYNFNIPGLTQFHPSWEFPHNREKLNNEDKKIFENVIFNLGMVEVISYLKSTCSPTLIVRTGNLTDEQIKWYKKLYINGLGEFFYVNNLVEEMNIDTFLDIKCESSRSNAEHLNVNHNLKGNLIPVGGGKDGYVLDYNGTIAKDFVYDGWLKMDDAQQYHYTDVDKYLNNEFLDKIEQKLLSKICDTNLSFSRRSYDNVTEINYEINR